jgi:hypothetical protein
MSRQPLSLSMIASTAHAQDQTWLDIPPGPQPAVPARHLALPRADQALAYACSWWAVMLPAWLQRHQLAPQAAGHYTAGFEASSALRERYDDLFDLRPDGQARPYPVLQAHCVATLLQARVLADLGVNRRHLTLLRHHTRLPLGACTFAATRQQTLDCRLQRLVRVSPTEVLALLQTRIASADGDTVASVDDVFVVQGLSPSEALRAEEDDDLRRAYSRSRRREPMIDPASGLVRRRQLFIGGDAGRRFARVSGDRRRLPLPRLNWRPSGRRPVVQDLYLRNLVVRELAEWGIDQDSLQITFTARARLGQTLSLLVEGDAFELVGEDDALVAFGQAA